MSTFLFRKTAVAALAGTALLLAATSGVAEATDVPKDGRAQGRQPTEGGTRRSSAPNPPALPPTAIPGARNPNPPQSPPTAAPGARNPSPPQSPPTAAPGGGGSSGTGERPGSGARPKAPTNASSGHCQGSPNCDVMMDGGKP